MIENNKVIKLILLGAPGSGKGSLAQQLEKYHFVQISTGDLFRKKLSQNDDEAKMIQAYINRGELIPDDVVNKLAIDAILEASKNHQNIILDGYPRTINQAKYLENVTTIDDVIYLNVDEKILFERITGRLTCSKCQKIYNIYSNPPKEKEVCDNCHIPLLKRRDDNKESFELRIREYKSKTLPLVDFYRNNKNVKFIELDQNENSSLENIVSDVLKEIGIQ